jgi:hypothetical protein
MKRLVNIVVALVLLVAAATVLSGGLGRVAAVDHSPYASALSNAAVGQAYAKHYPQDPYPCADMTCSAYNGCYHHTGAGTDCFYSYGGGDCENVPCQ